MIRMLERVGEKQELYRRVVKNRVLTLGGTVGGALEFLDCEYPEGRDIPRWKAVAEFRVRTDLLKAIRDNGFGSTLPLEKLPDDPVNEGGRPTPFM